MNGRQFNELKSTIIGGIAIIVWAIVWVANGMPTPDGGLMVMIFAPISIIGGLIWFFASDVDEEWKAGVGIVLILGILFAVRYISIITR